MTGSRRTLVALGLLVTVTAAVPDRAIALGDQRSGTSSGTFLKIAVDPRGAAMGSAVVADAPGLTALTWNPASLTSLDGTQIMGSYTRWPGDIDYSYVAAATFVERVNGHVGLQLGYLGVVMDETTEAAPGGTGRNFGVRDWYLGVTYARQFTDQLSFGATARLVREELGEEVGGPATTNVLFDFGTLYFADFLDMKLAFSLQHFGPEFTPSGQYLSAATGALTSYESFAPPTTFRLGISLPVIRRGDAEVRGQLEMNNFADADETIRVGAEAGFDRQFYVRSGYDLTADAMKFSAGVGLRTQFGFSSGDLDYAYTDAGPLGEVHRLAIRIDL